MVLAHIGMDHKDEALTYLERGYEAHSTALTAFNYYDGKRIQRDRANGVFKRLARRVYRVNDAKHAKSRWLAKQKNQRV